MKTQSNLILNCLLLVLILSSVMTSGMAAPAIVDEHFSVKEYNHFHEILHMLQHEALPNKDFKTIRTNAGELATRGDAIVKLGVPAGVKDPAEFEKELKNFSAALVKYKNDASAGSDTQLEESYSAVHDSFEMLASMLPRKKQ